MLRCARLSGLSSSRGSSEVWNISFQIISAVLGKQQVSQQVSQVGKTLGVLPTETLSGKYKRHRFDWQVQEWAVCFKLTWLQCGFKLLFLKRGWMYFLLVCSQLTGSFSVTSCVWVNSPVWTSCRGSLSAETSLWSGSFSCSGTSSFCPAGRKKCHRWRREGKERWETVGRDRWRREMKRKDK